MIRPMLVTRHRRWVSVWLLSATLFGMGGLTSPAAWADSDQVTERADITYRLDRRGEQIDVAAAFSLTNRIPNSATARYFIEEWGPIAVPMYAQDFRVTGRRVTYRLGSKDADWRYYVVRFPRILLGQSVSFDASWTLPSRGSKSDNPTRVTDAYSHFCWYGQPVDSGHIQATLPRIAEAETEGSAVRTQTRAKSLQLTARQRTDLITFGACTDVYDGSLLERRDLDSTTGHRVIVEGWPDDPTWLANTASSVELALARLDEVIAEPIPGDPDILVREAAANALAGYGGYYDSDSGVIRVSEKSDDYLLLAHEIAHSWFNSDTVAATWIAEGLAEWAARTSIDVPCTDPGQYPGKGSPKLGKWQYLGYRPKASKVALVTYQYEAACWIMTKVSDTIGPDRMRDVIEVLLGGRSPYDRLIGSLPGTPTVASDSLAGPGDAPPPSLSWGRDDRAFVVTDDHQRPSNSRGRLAAVAGSRGRDRAGPGRYQRSVHRRGSDRDIWHRDTQEAS